MTRAPSPHPDQLLLDWEQDPAVQAAIEARVAQRAEAAAFRWRLRLVAIETSMMGALVTIAGLALRQPVLPALRAGIIVAALLCERHAADRSFRRLRQADVAPAAGEASVNGIFSSTPAPGPIRLLVGSQGLLLVQSCIACQLPAVPGRFRLLVVITAIIATVAVISAAIGEDRNGGQAGWRRRHGR